MTVSPADVRAAVGSGSGFAGDLWDRLRARLMTALPDFPGKSKLPPYGATA